MGGRSGGKGGAVGSNGGDPGGLSWELSGGECIGTSGSSSPACLSSGSGGSSLTPASGGFSSSVI